ncbi:hypothetical protein HMPREF9075_01289 [Capnocytophaga sp. oral taxon 332 str. F0381]|nr:hypothetical protein HMPREF9075_01289 [Capnocytophaga sp. oral taxon 332 str. F0381]
MLCLSQMRCKGTTNFETCKFFGRKILIFFIFIFYMFKNQ